MASCVHRVKAPTQTRYALGSPGFPASNLALAERRAHAVRPYGEPTRLGAGGVRASRKKSELTIVTTPIVQNAVV